MQANDLLFQDVFRASPIGVAVENLEGQPLFVNPALCSMLGFSEEEMLAKHCVDFSPPEDAERDWVLFMKLKAGAIDRYSLDKRFYRKDGSMIWGRLSISLLNGGGTPLVVAAVEDITDRKLAEELLWHQQKELRQAQQVAQLGSWYWDLSTDRVTWSEELYRITGCNPQLPPPHYKEHGDVFTAESWQRLQRAVERTLRTGDPYELDLEVRRPDGTTRWMIGRGEAEKDAMGRIVCLRGTAQDITDRRRAEEVRSRLASIVESSEDAISSADVDGFFTSWNRGAQRMFGYTAEEAIGKPITLVVPLELHDEANDILRRLRAGERVEQYETRRVAKDGRSIEVSFTLSPLKDAEGKIIGASNIWRDITASKRAQQALSTVSQRLIEAQEEERSWIARELHDDINQRLALLAVTLDGLSRDLPASSNGLKKAIDQATKRLNDVTMDVQALSHRLHSSRLEHLGLEKAAASFCRELSGRHQTPVDFRAENVPNDLSKEISLCLFRVLQEALQNAIKYSESPGYRAVLRGQATAIELTVQDWGKGFLLDEAMRTGGIGLLSMNERMKLVDGKVSIDSQPGQGTIIQARVPLPAKAKSARVDA